MATRTIGDGCSTNAYQQRQPQASTRVRQKHRKKKQRDIFSFGFWCIFYILFYFYVRAYVVTFVTTSPPSPPPPPIKTYRWFRSIGGAVLVNPWNTTELTEQMIGAINMEANEREIR